MVVLPAPPFVFANVITGINISDSMVHHGEKPCVWLVLSASSVMMERCFTNKLAPRLLQQQ
jgi:hypothetical protein